MLQRRAALTGKLRSQDAGGKGRGVPTRSATFAGSAKGPGTEAAGVQAHQVDTLFSRDPTNPGQGRTNSPAQPAISAARRQNGQALDAYSEQELPLKRSATRNKQIVEQALDPLAADTRDRRVPFRLTDHSRLITGHRTESGQTIASFPDPTSQLEIRSAQQAHLTYRVAHKWSEIMASNLWAKHQREMADSATTVQRRSDRTTTGSHPLRLRFSRVHRKVERTSWVGRRRAPRQLDRTGRSPDH